MSKSIDKETEELKDFLITAGVEEEEHYAKIFFDEKQYTVRIPKEVGDMLKINTKKDVFKFILKVQPATSKRKHELKGLLVRGK